MKNNSQFSSIHDLFTKDRNILTVSELTRRIKSCLENSISYVWVTGEISNLRVPISGHHYFSLKDEYAQIKCVLWQATARNHKFAIKDGMEIILFGHVSVYDKGGEYQIVVDRIEPKGLGAQQLALTQLKERLQKEGLFELSHKKPIPFLPSVIGIITSPTGAAIRDILNIINRRFPDIKILIYPVKVQGAEAEGEIVKAIIEMNDYNLSDVLILARGGGSTEDLSLFNTESLARAIYQSRIPVISAIGHEIDLTIADLVADKRAATPSEAAELVVPVKSELLIQLKNLLNKLTEGLRHQTNVARLRLDALRDSYALKQPLEQFRQYQQRVDELSPRLLKAFASILQASRQKAGEMTKRLESLSPLKVIGRGYSITLNAQTQKIVRSINEVKEQDIISTQLTDGKINSRIIEIMKALQ